MKKISYYILAGVCLLGLLDFFLEYPTFGNLEILFPKSLETKLFYSNYLEADQLSIDDQLQIYNLILSDYKSYCLKDSLLNFAGLINIENQYLIPIAESTKKKMKHKFGALNSKKMFFTSQAEIIDDTGNINTEYEAAITLSPIKKIDEVYYVGYNAWVTPLGSYGGVLEVSRKDGVWYEYKVVLHWLS